MKDKYRSISVYYKYRTKKILPFKRFLFNLIISTIKPDFFPDKTCDLNIINSRILCGFLY